MTDLETLREIRRSVREGEMSVEVDERPSGLKSRLDMGEQLTITEEEHNQMNEYVKTYDEFLAELYKASNGGEQELTDEVLGELIFNHSDDSEAFSAEFLAVFAGWYSEDEETFQTAVQAVEE